MTRRRSYEAKDITVMSAMEGVRAHPGMYLGDVDASGTLQCLREVLQNSTDEMGEVGGGRVRVAIDGDRVTVADEGRGIPVDVHPETRRPALETVMTRLHAGGKAGSKTAYGDRTIGVHGVGASVVNALSASMDVWSYRDGRWRHMAFARGVPRGGLDARPPPFRWRRGTVVSYVLDRSVLPSDLDLVSARGLCDIARHFSPVDVDYADGERTLSMRRRTPGDWLDRSLRREGLEPTVPPLVVRTGGVRLVLCWTRAVDRLVHAHVSGAPVPSGAHVRGLYDAVDAAVRGAHPRASRGCADVSVGLRAALDVTVDQPTFSGQAKTNLKTHSALALVRDAAEAPLRAHLRRHRAEAEAMLEHAAAIAAIDAGAAERKKLARDAEMPRGRMSFPKGFIAALSYPADRRELILCEGNSAAGTVKDAKMPWQEVLPLRGKMANVVSRRDAATSSEVVGNILRTVGYDPRDPARPTRVARVAIMTDADDDGHHIAVLLLTIFQRVMPSLLREGRVFVVDTPLFEARTASGHTVAGDVLSDMQREHGRLTSVNRMKGLGGCPVPLLRRIATDPATRRWLCVSSPSRDDAAELAALMGPDSGARKALLSGGESTGRKGSSDDLRERHRGRDGGGGGDGRRRVARGDGARAAGER